MSTGSSQSFGIFHLIAGAPRSGVWWGFSFSFALTVPLLSVHSLSRAHSTWAGAKAGTILVRPPPVLSTKVILVKELATQKGLPPALLVANHHYCLILTMAA